MPNRSRPSRTALLAALAVCSALVAGGTGVASAPAARADTARSVARGPPEGMMPADSPDAVRTPASKVRVPATTSTTAQAAGGAEAAATALPGIDVAGFQHPNGAAIDWTKVAAGGQRFAVVKATEYYTDDATHQPVLYTNPNLSADVTGADAAGLSVGAYVFARPQNPAVVQADQFAAAIKGLPLDLPPVLDLEATGGLPPAQLALWTQTFLDRLQRTTGIVPMIYSSPNFWNTSMGGSTAFVDHPLWVAHYTDAPAPTLFGGWTSWDLWQYSQTGTVPGITGPVDLDRFNGTDPAALAERVTSAPLTAPATLAAGRSLFSPSQQYRLDVQADGNLVEYGNGRALWSTRTNGNAGVRLDLQPDGNLVLYSAANRPLWSSVTYGSGSGAQLAVQDDGNVVLSNGSRVLWSNGFPGSDTLTAGAALAPGQSLHSPSFQYRLDVQADGNVVEYGNGRALWSTRTYPSSGVHLDLQPDGNLVLYSADGRPLWSSGTYGSGAGNRLVVQDDGNVVLYSGTRAVWNNGSPGSDTLTAGAGLTPGQSLHSPGYRYRLDLQPDGNLVEYDNGRPVWSSGTYVNFGTHLDLQRDGNLVLYAADQRPLWHTSTWGSGSGNRLVVQDDGNVVLYDGNRPLWASLYR